MGRGVELQGGLFAASFVVLERRLLGVADLLGDEAKLPHTCELGHERPTLMAASYSRVFKSAPAATAG